MYLETLEITAEQSKESDEAGIERRQYTELPIQEIELTIFVIRVL